MHSQVSPNKSHLKLLFIGRTIWGLSEEGLNDINNQIHNFLYVCLELNKKIQTNTL